MTNTTILAEKVLFASMEKDGQKLILIRPASRSVAGVDDLFVFLSENQEQMTTLLRESGGILFRGFDIADRDGFLRAKRGFPGAGDFDYVDGNSPRTKLSAAVYTSTEYPKEFPISLHSELSYSNRWPSLLFFFCKVPAGEGGETPVADLRHVLQRLGPDITRKFEDLGVKYTRFLSGIRGMGKTWMDTFETQDKSIVEGHCRKNGIQFRWDGKSLLLSQIGPGVIAHPVTGEKVWFNQANQFHPSGLPADIRKALKLMYKDDWDRYPQYSFYGNGEPIPEEILYRVTEMHFECALKFPWEKGDMLVLDNFLMAHGRMPYNGPREILVSMS